jgi:hypothetical protein
MSRKRSLSPTIWEDPSINKLSRDGRLAFIGIISNADDDGYLRGDYGSLKRLIFGFDDDSKKEWYDELKKFKGLHFFEVNDETYVHLVNWEKYQVQKSDRRLASLCPKCPKCIVSVGQVEDKCRAGGGQVADKEKRSEVKLSKEKRSEVKGMSPNGGDIPNSSSFSKSGNTKSAIPPTARKGKPFFWDQEMRFAQRKWWVMPKEGGNWKEFTGKEKDIVWK